MPGGNTWDCLEGRGVGQECVGGDHFSGIQTGELQEPSQLSAAASPPA